VTVLTGHKIGIQNSVLA